MENNNTIFLTGDRVFHIQWGWGTVMNIFHGSLYVRFDIRNKEYDLVAFPKLDNKTLSFTEYTLEGFSQERPEELPKIGDIVWVKDADDTDWYIGYFKGMVGNRFNCNTSKTGSYDVTWDQMTTKDPHADGKQN
jgi:hypothetical protein